MLLHTVQVSVVWSLFLHCPTDHGSFSLVGLCHILGLLLLFVLAVVVVLAAAAGANGVGGVGGRLVLDGQGDIGPEDVAGSKIKK